MTTERLCKQCLRQGTLTPLAVRPRDHAVDHITPKAKGGTDDDDNLQSLCTACHDAKTLADNADVRGYQPRRVIGADGWPVE